MTEPHDESDQAERSPASRDELVRALLYDHNRINLNTVATHDALAKIDALVETLIEAGVVDRERYESHRSAAADRLRQDFVHKGMGVTIDETPGSKYDVVDLPEIDCAARIPACKAACCRLQFALSKEDVDEGVVRWDVGTPYLIQRRPNGQCGHLDVVQQRCQVYAHRPRPCRNYDCRDDPRVWLDFEAGIANPMIDDPQWPQCVTNPSSDSGSE